MRSAQRFDFHNIGDLVKQILDEMDSNPHRSNSDQGTDFENLTIEVLEYFSEYEVSQVWHWANWPEREQHTGLDGRDTGIDLVAVRNDGSFIAIQCKCHRETNKVDKPDIDSFLATSQRPIFTQRWIITTSDWTDNANNQIKGLMPEVKRIDFLIQHAHSNLPRFIKDKSVRTLLPQQQNAFDGVIDGFQYHNRGRLIMPCGTGKTFTSLRIAEHVVPEGGRILFCCPSIALVSQARREWLEHATRDLYSLVVCSDRSAGGKYKKEDMSVTELICDVTTNPAEVAEMLKDNDGRTKVIFCTYQSLSSAVIVAQLQHNAPAFDLTLCDEAHRTVGVDRSSLEEEDNTGFQAVHHELQSTKRLYMTATEKRFTLASKKSHATKGIEVIDMSNQEIYGPEFFRLKFKDAVNQNLLSDYRVILMGVDENSIPKGLQRQLVALADEEEETNYFRPKSTPVIVTKEDLQRVLATSLAINGIVRGTEIETPKQLYRTIAFANSIKNSKYYAKALAHSELKKFVTRQTKDGKALATAIKHLDASDSSYKRLKALQDLEEAENIKTAHILCNVGLFSEGVDVPSLDAIAFLEPRKSQIEIVQAVGRVMRKAPGKRLGYIIVPIPITANQTLREALEEGTAGYQVVGQVLRALQSHDERLAENIAHFVQIGSARAEKDSEASNLIFDFIKGEEAGRGIYAQLVTASGLGKGGQLVTDEIKAEIERATAILMEGRTEAVDGADFIDDLALALGEHIDDNEADICKIGALLIANACLLQKRLSSVESWQSRLPDMMAIARAGLNATKLLKEAWETILDTDYKPIFEPALAVLDALPNRPFVAKCVRMLAERANNVADALTDLGYDHAGSLYHRIMPNAQAMGAFYTNNLSALLLAKLAIKKDFVDWHDDEAIKKIKIMDPACGTGTLLMACVKVIKERFIEARKLVLSDLSHKEKLATLHQILVENTIHGLDINQCGIQLAASNLTLGAPSVDYSRMNLHTLKHGIQPNGEAKAGSLDILNTDNQQSIIQSVQTYHTQVNDEDITFPISKLKLVIMNPPFTDNVKRHARYQVDDRKRMQQHEKDIRNAVALLDHEAGETINFNAISTYFTPLADSLLHAQHGVLASIIPTTACVGRAGLESRRFISQRFHLKYVITLHDPERPAFSENCALSESLLIGSRHIHTPPPETEFISLKRMPQTQEDVETLFEAISRENSSSAKWLNKISWASALVQSGDWTPVQWMNGQLAVIANNFNQHRALELVGKRHEIEPAGRRIADAYMQCEPTHPGARPIFWSISKNIRTKLLSEPDSHQCPKPNKVDLAEKYWSLRSHALLASRYNTKCNSLVAVWSEMPSVGNGFVPISIDNERQGKGLVAWWNSTPVMLMLLNQRSKTLLYPKWSLAQLRSVAIPKPDNPAWDDLADAFEVIKDKTILTLKEGEKCEVRRVIDKAAAKALNIDENEIARWRSMLAQEPTISGQVAE